MKNKKGSTIVWAITLIMVLVVIVGASLSFAYMSYNQSIKNRNKYKECKISCSELCICIKKCSKKWNFKPCNT